MPARFLNPNYHVILIHYPLGVFVLGVVLELFTLIWANASLRSAARWMILLGGLASLPAALSGIYALADVYQTVGPEQARYLRFHVYLQSIGTLLAVAAVVIGLGASEAGRERLHLPLLAAFVFSVGLMIAGSWFGGETVYRQGTAVLPLAPKSASDESKTPHPGLGAKIDYYVGDPLQIHMILVGGVLALAMAALGLTKRPLSKSGPADPSPNQGDETGPRLGFGADRGPAVRFAPASVETSVPATRFWLFASLFAVLTSTVGYWMWAQDAKQWTPQRFWKEVMMDDGPRLVLTRTSAHVWAGGSILVLLLIFAAVARWAAAKKMVVGVLALLLILVLATQVWLGVLLTFDPSGESLTHFGEGTAPEPRVHDQAK